jgi:hypothetical protein
MPRVHRRDSELVDRWRQLQSTAPSKISSSTTNCRWAAGQSHGAVQRRGGVASDVRLSRLHPALSLADNGTSPSAPMTTTRNVALLASLLKADSTDESLLPARHRNAAAAARESAWLPDAAITRPREIVGASAAAAAAPASPVVRGLDPHVQNLTGADSGDCISDVFIVDSQRHRQVADDAVFSPMWDCANVSGSEVADDMSYLYPVVENDCNLVVTLSSSVPLLSRSATKQQTGRLRQLSSLDSPVDSVIDDFDDEYADQLSLSSSSIAAAASAVTATAVELPPSPWQPMSLSESVAESMLPLAAKSSVELRMSSDGYQSAETSPLTTSTDEGPTPSDGWWWPLDRSSIDLDWPLASQSTIKDKSDSMTGIDGQRYVTCCYGDDELPMAPAAEQFIGISDEEVECGLSMFNLVGVGQSDSICGETFGANGQFVAD